MVISGAVGRHRCDRMLQLDTFCGFIRAHIFDYFILLLFVCVCPASSSRWMGRYRLYLILFLSLAACFWVIEYNNKGGPFSKCTKFPWTVELADYILLSWFLFRSGRRKKIIFNSFKLHLVCLLDKCGTFLLPFSVWTRLKCSHDPTPVYTMQLY
jgi:hypothetical protein